MTAVELPLGISESYDLLSPTGEMLEVLCPDCDRIFADQWRKGHDGAGVLAIFCPDCRACRRLRFAAALPVVRALRPSARAHIVKIARKMLRLMKRWEKGAARTAG